MMGFASARQSTSYRFILVGKTGSGKSATGNLILERNVFLSEESLESVTQEITAASSLDLDGNNILVVDTPGLFDTEKPVIQTALKIQKSLNFVPPGPHAFLIVLKYGRFTPEEGKAIEILMVMFGPNFIHNAIIIWTHADKIRDHNQFLRSCENNLQIKSLLDKCGRRFITINNNVTGEIARNERRKIMLMVDTLSVNGTQFYQDDISIYKDSLERYANEWTDTSWDIGNLQTILQEQQKEVARVKKKMQDILRTERKEKLEGLERNTNKVIEELETELDKANENKARTRMKQMEKLNKSLSTQTERRYEKLRKVNQSRKDVTDNCIKELEEMSEDEIQGLMKKMHNFRIQQNQTEQLRAIQTQMENKIVTLKKEWEARDKLNDEQRQTAVRTMEAKGRQAIEDLFEKWKSVDERETREIRECSEKFKSESKLSLDRLRAEWQTITEIQDKIWTDKLARVEIDCRKNSEKVEKDCKAKIDENDRKQARRIKMLKTSWNRESDDLETDWERTDVMEKQSKVLTLKKHLRGCRMETDNLLASWAAEHERIEKDDIRKRFESIAIRDQAAKTQDNSDVIATTALAATGTLYTSTGMMMAAAAAPLGPVALIPLIGAVAGAVVGTVSAALSNKDKK